MDNTPEKTSSYSHPDQPVRHSYPLAVREEGFSSAVSICLRTWPFIAMRFGVLAAFTLAAVIWVAFLAGIAALFSRKDGGGGGGIIFFLIALGIPSALYFWLKQYILYLLKLGHVAVITQIIVHGDVPSDMAQVAYGKKIITDRFAQTNILFVLDSLITGTVKAFNRTLDWVANLLPIPGLDGVMQVVNAIVTNATTFIDETIFSYNLARGDENPWRSSVDGLIYYAQNAKPVLKTAIFALILEYAVTFGAFLICLIPAWLISLVLPASVSGWAWLIALVLALAVRSSVFRPLFLTMVALSFHVNSEGKEVNLSMAEVLGNASDKFQELSRRANEWVQSERKPVVEAA